MFTGVAKNTGGAVHQGKESHFKLFKESEAEYSMLNQDGISYSRHVYAQNAVDTIFCSESGIRSVVHWFIPRQYQCTTLDEERTLLKRHKTKHIKAKFFFIKDRVDDGKI